jgi:hypothetical protein
MLATKLLLAKHCVYLITPTSSQITRDNRRFQNLILLENESALSRKSNNNLLSHLIRGSNRATEDVL